MRAYEQRLTENKLEITKLTKTKTPFGQSILPFSLQTFVLPLSEPFYARERGFREEIASFQAILAW